MAGHFGRALARTLGAAGRGRGDRILALTGLSSEGWGELAAVYDLPPDPAPKAARLRALLARKASRALATGRWPLALEGDPPEAAPCLYATAHLGSLQVLRYALRSRGVPAAVVLGRYNLDRTRAVVQDEVFDRRHRLDFPHAMPFSAVHRLRSALARGSLIAAADMPERGGVAARVLGGPALLDPRPFRLARAAGVPCRPAFATIADGVWTLTLGPRLSSDPHEAAAQFGRRFAAAAAAAPLDLDAVVYASRARQSR